MTDTSSVGTVVLDLDGVLYLDSQGVPGAGDALEAISAMGWDMIFATNNSTKTPDSVVDHIRARTGFLADAQKAVTSAGAAARYVAERHTTAHVLGAPSISGALEARGVSVAETDRPGAVVVGLDLDLTYDSIDRSSRLIRNGAEFVATNIDSTYPTPTGLAPGAGSIVAAVSAASGVAPINCGKPTPVFMEQVVEKIEARDRIWMVGDRPDTDIAMAKAGGWTSALVLTGVTRSADDIPDRYAPDHTVASIVDLPDLLAESLSGAPSGG